MGKLYATSSVEGGTIKREAATGRFVEVRASGKTAKATAGSVVTVRAASEKRSAALKRLADR